MDILEYIYCLQDFFSKFYLPDVVSLVFELFTVMSHVVSILVDDNELFTMSCHLYPS